MQNKDVLVVCSLPQGSLDIDEGLRSSVTHRYVFCRKLVCGLGNIPDFLEVCVVTSCQDTGACHENGTLVINRQTTQFHTTNALSREPLSCRSGECKKAGLAIAVQDEWLLLASFQRSDVEKGSTHDQPTIRPDGNIIDDGISCGAVYSEEPFGLPVLGVSILLNRNEDAVFPILAQHRSSVGSNTELSAVCPGRKRPCSYCLAHRGKSFHRAKGRGPVCKAPERSLIADKLRMGTSGEDHDKGHGHHEGAAGSGNHLL